MRRWIPYGSQQTLVFLRSNREPAMHFYAGVWNTQGMTRKGYLNDVCDDEWAFVATYLTLMREDAPERENPLRAVFNGLRYIVHMGMQWRMMPHDLLPWHTVYQQTQRWLKAGVFDDMVDDLRMLKRELDDRMQQSRAAILDSRMWVGLQFVAFAILLAKRFVTFMVQNA